MQQENRDSDQQVKFTSPDAVVSGSQYPIKLIVRQDAGKRLVQNFGPAFRTGVIVDQILPDFDGDMGQAIGFRVVVDGVVGWVFTRIGLVIADIKPLGVGAQSF